MIDNGRLGPFVLEQRLGNQQSGCVYHAVHIQRRRAMAVRLVTQYLVASGASVQQFAKEVEFLKTLEHRNVVRTFGGGVFDDQAYLATELVQGKSLDEMLSRGPLPWQTVVDYIVQACEGLEYAHQRGTVHQNLTTAKLILAADGKIKITDFRGQRLNEYDRWNDVQPRRSVVAYLAPEQLRGEKSTTPKADLYALGCIMYELLTGHLPFQAATPAELREKHLHEVPPRIRTEVFDCPIWLEELVAQMLEKDPARRPHFASSVKVALEEVKERAAVGAGVVQHAVKGASSALRAPDGHSEVRRLLRPKKRAKSRNEWVPLHERGWFLAVCGLIAVALVTWAFWPESEDQLFAKAEELMSSSNPADWQVAREQYIEPMLERFPVGKHTAAAQAFITKIDVEQARRRFDVNLRLGREPRTVAERRYLEAWRAQQEGDRELALSKLEQLIAEVPATGEDAPFVRLAEQEAAELKQKLAALAAEKAAAETAAEPNATEPATVRPIPPTDEPEPRPVTGEIPAANVAP